MKIEQGEVIVKFDFALKPMNGEQWKILPMVLKEHIHKVLFDVSRSRDFWYENLRVDINVEVENE